MNPQEINQFFISEIDKIIASKTEPVYWAGIGSRGTPESILIKMTEISCVLSTGNCILRSGAASGADTAFYNGSSRSKREIFLPWEGFNNFRSDGTFIVPDDTIFKQAMEIASKFHPAWDKCSFGAKKLHARNSFQILGADLQTPSSFVVCYTKDGLTGGGTGQAIRIANHYNIPVFDYGKYMYKQ